jgi:hypothetical protein
LASILARGEAISLDRKLVDEILALEGVKGFEPSDLVGQGVGLQNTRIGFEHQSRPEAARKQDRGRFAISKR